MTGPLLGDGVTPERPLGVSEGPSARDVSGEAHRTTERAAMAEIAHGANDTSITSTTFWTSSPYDQIENVVDALLVAGYRLVSEDDDTVERVARAMLAARLPSEQDDLDALRQWHHSGDSVRDGWRRTARAALAALRGGAE